MNFENKGLLQSITMAGERNICHENEFVDPATGLKRCRICGGAKQTVIQLDGPPIVVPCTCKCDQEREREIKQRQAEIEADFRRSACFQGTSMKGCTFSADDRENPMRFDAMRLYAETFQEYLNKENGLNGLLLYGGVGTGKSFYAACIANRVIDLGYRARMTNFSQLSDHLQGTWEKDDFIRDLMRYQLLILDDLGAERKSDFMQDMVFKVIDARCRDGKPMIITTNLTPDELSKANGVCQNRIYDRIFERCLPTAVEGMSRRRRGAVEKWSAMRAELGL